MLKNPITLAVVGLITLVVLAVQAAPVGAQYPPEPDGASALLASNPQPSIGESVSVAVVLTDAAGDPAVGVLCAFEIVAQPGDDAELEDSSATSDENGVASTALNVGSTSGVIEVDAQCGGLNRSVTIVASEPVPQQTDQAAPPASIPDSLPSAGSGSVASGESSHLMSLVVVLAGGGLLALALARRQRRSHL